MSSKKTKPKAQKDQANNDTSEKIQAQRERIVEAMNLVYTTALSCEPEELSGMSRRGTLEAVHRLLDNIAWELGSISGQ